MDIARSALVAIALVGGTAPLPTASAFAQNPPQIDTVPLTQAAEEDWAETRNLVISILKTGSDAQITEGRALASARAVGKPIPTAMKT